MQVIEIELPQSLTASSERLKNVLQEILSDRGYRDYQVTVTSADDRLMSELNQRFYGALGPTDVLSFTIEENPLEGEIYVNENQIYQAVQSEGTSPEYQLYKLLIHGTLHLTGCHHGNEDEAEKSFKMMQEYLDKFIEK